MSSSRNGDHDLSHELRRCVGVKGNTTTSRTTPTKTAFLELYQWMPTLECLRVRTAPGTSGSRRRRARPVHHYRQRRLHVSRLAEFCEPHTELVLTSQAGFDTCARR